MKNVFNAKAPRTVINIESVSTTANQKKISVLETVDIEVSQRQALDEGSVCRFFFVDNLKQKIFIR